jgi:hypothetical protein
MKENAKLQDYKLPNPPRVPQCQPQAAMGWDPMANLIWGAVLW